MASTLGDLGDSGFGLNYNRGFAPMKGFTVASNMFGGGGGGTNDYLAWLHQQDLAKLQGQTQKDVAGINAGVQDRATQGRLQEAQVGLQGQLAGQDTNRYLGQLQAGTQAAGQGLDWQKAQLQAATQGQGYQTELAKTGMQTEASKYGYDTQLKQAQTAADAQRYGYDQAYQQALVAADASKYGANQQLAGTQAQAAASRYGADQQLTAARGAQDVQRYGYDQQLRESQIQADASKYPYQLKQQRWDQLFPMLQQQLSTGSGGAGGPVGRQPQIDAGPVYSPGMIQQQVNAQRGQNDLATAAQVRQMQQGLAGRGFGAGSPLAAALGAAYQGQNLATNTANERDLRLGSATTNAQQVLAGQKAQEGQYASRQQEEIERQKVLASRYSTLLGALGQFAA